MLLNGLMTISQVGDTYNKAKAAYLKLEPKVKTGVIKKAELKPLEDRLKELETLVDDLIEQPKARRSVTEEVRAQEISLEVIALANGLDQRPQIVPLPAKKNPDSNPKTVSSVVSVDKNVLIYGGIAVGTLAVLALLLRR